MPGSPLIIVATAGPIVLRNVLTISTAKTLNANVPTPPQNSVKYCALTNKYASVAIPYAHARIATIFGPLIRFSLFSSAIRTILPMVEVANTIINKFWFT